MADQQLVAQNFDLGMQQDRSRDQLPRGAAWAIRDYIPQDGAPARKRGGWGFGSADLNAISSSAYAIAGAWAPFPGAGHLVVVTNTAKLFRMGPGSAIDATAGTLVDASFVRTPATRPFWHKDRVIFPVGLGQSTIDPMKYYDSGGGTYVDAAVGGTPPRFTRGWSYGDYLMGANGYDPASSYALRPQSLWNSNVGNPDGWNTGAAGGRTDFPEEIVGGLYNRVHLVWGWSKLWIIDGTIPPPGGDFAIRTLYNVGCFDERSIVPYREYAVWANAEGIWRTDGSTLTDLTTQAELSKLWRSYTANFNYSTGWTCAGGILHGQYWCTITNNAGVNVVTFVIDMNTFVGVTMTNIKTPMYVPRLSAQGTSLEGGQDELFAMWRAGARVMRLSQVWTPASANRFDADGTAVLPEIETAAFKLGRTEEKRFRYAYLGYDLRDGGEAPKIAVGYTLDPYTSPSSYTEGSYQYPATTIFDRQRIDIRRSSESVALRIRQTAASAETRIGEIELEGWPIEASR